MGKGGRGEAGAALERKEEKFEHLDGKRSDARLKKGVAGFMSGRHLHGLSIVISDNKSRPKHGTVAAVHRRRCSRCRRIVAAFNLYTSRCTAVAAGLGVIERASVFLDNNALATSAA